MPRIRKDMRDRAWYASGCYPHYIPHGILILQEQKEKKIKKKWWGITPPYKLYDGNK